jgi:hypothetical protein
MLVVTKGKKMNKLVTAVLALLATAVAANAANLPERKKAPEAPQAPAIQVPAAWYVGVNAGGNYRRGDSFGDIPGVSGLVVGRNINSQFAVEATFDYYFKKDSHKENHRGTVNAVYTPVDLFGFRPYALAGVGEEARNFEVVKKGDARAIYNLGAGVKYAVSKDWETDLRYRFAKDWAGKDHDSNVVTFGVNYKF